MELTLNDKELKGLSLAFRSTAGRFLRGDSNDAIDNLRRFLTLIEGTPVLAAFLAEHQTETWDMATICAEREWRSRYPIPTDVSGEIAFTYQLLRHIRQVANDPYDIHRFTHGYGGGSKFARDFEAFSQSVVHPFVNHISHYLEGLMDEIMRPDEGRVTVNNFGSMGQLNLAQDNSSIVAINSQDDVNSLRELASRLLAAIEEPGVPAEVKENVKDATQATIEEVSSKQPKKSILSMCSKTITAAIQNLPTTLNAVRAGQELVTLIKQWIS